MGDGRRRERRGNGVGSGCVKHDEGSWREAGAADNNKLRTATREGKSRESVIPRPIRVFGNGCHNNHHN